MRRGDNADRFHGLSPRQTNKFGMGDVGNCVQGPVRDDFPQLVEMISRSGRNSDLENFR